MPVPELLGPANLAYLSPRESPDEFRTLAGPAISEREVGDPAINRFLAEADPAERGESGLAEVTSAAFAVVQSGQVLSAAGYVRWPNGFAHVCVLTAANARGRGLARLAGSAAVAQALGEGLVPQWRARLAASRAVARSLRFTDLGTQLSLRVGP